MAFDPKVIILGAGAAGLSAAAELAHAGLTVLILEARDRLGGRIYTKHDSVCNVPVELGAEFVHGRPPEIWALLRKHNAGMKEIVGEDFCVRDGKLSECDFFSEVDKLLKQMDDRAPDQSFLEFVEHNDQGHETKEWARGYVSGFHAADPGLISVHSLVKGLRADKKIEADRPFRIPQGYAFVIDLFRQELTGGAFQSS